MKVSVNVISILYGILDSRFQVPGLERSNFGRQRTKAIPYHNKSQPAGTLSHIRSNEINLSNESIIPSSYCMLFWEEKRRNWLFPLTHVICPALEIISY